MNNRQPLSKQMDWGILQWRKGIREDEKWNDFNADENAVIERAWDRGDTSVFLLWSGKPMELSFISWTMLDLVTH